MNHQLIKKIADQFYQGDQAKAKEFIKASKNFMDMLSLVVEDRKQSLERGEADYDSPSWAFRQAHYNGKRETLDEVLALLEVKG